MSSRRVSRGLAIAWIALSLAAGAPCGVPSPAVAGQTPSFSKETIDRTLQQVIGDQNIQHDPPQPDKPPDFHFNWNLGDLRIPLYVLLGIGLVVVLWYVARAVIDISRPTGAAVAKEASETVTSQPLAADEPQTLPELEEIMRLARAGDFDGAIHLLLLQGLRQLVRLTGAVMALSLTSREILRRPDLPQGAGRDLATLVDAVEISRFGGRAAGATLFETCLASYRRLAQATPLPAQSSPMLASS